MKKVMMLTAAVMCFAFAAQAQLTAPQYENCVETRGQAEKEIVPDEIYVRIVIDEAALKNKNSVEDLEQKMIKGLKQAGVDTDEDLRIGDMSSKYYKQAFRKASGATRATYQLKVNGAVQLGKVYQALEAAGISNLSIIRLSHSKIKEYENEVRVEAIRQAKANAEALAGAIGQSIGKAIYIMDYSAPYLDTPMARPEMMYAVKDTGAGGGGYETPLDFRTIKLTYNVTAKFVLE